MLLFAILPCFFLNKVNWILLYRSDNNVTAAALLYVLLHKTLNTGVCRNLLRE